MTAFLLYILRGGLYLGLFYTFFLLVMRKTTFFRLNRVLLLAGSYLCLPPVGAGRERPLVQLRPEGRDQPGGLGNQAGRNLLVI